jgi:F0F1-type ATP synthase membrane subunit b/b'
MEIWLSNPEFLPVAIPMIILILLILYIAWMPIKD